MLGSSLGLICTLCGTMVQVYPATLQEYESELGLSWALLGSSSPGSAEREASPALLSLPQQYPSSSPSCIHKSV